MRLKPVLKFFIFITLLAGLVNFLLVPVMEKLVCNKAEQILNRAFPQQVTDIHKVRIFLFSSSLFAEKISFKDTSGNQSSGEIKKFTLKNIGFIRFIFNGEINIQEIDIQGFTFRGKWPEKRASGKNGMSPFRIKIGRIHFNIDHLLLKHREKPLEIAITKGSLGFRDISLNKDDSLNFEDFGDPEVSADSVLVTSADSNYTFIFNKPRYEADSNKISLIRLQIQPNYNPLAFAEKHRYQTDRINATLDSLFIRGFSLINYLNHADMICKWVLVKKMETKIFRDLRYEFRHIEKKPFQQFIYEYRGILNIDSITIRSADITYIEHAEKAEKPGHISFNSAMITIRNISNNQAHAGSYFTLEGRAMLMERANIKVNLKTLLFNKNNAFALIGTIDGTDIEIFNPMMENTSFISAKEGTIESFRFSMTADMDYATGSLIMQYNNFKFEKYPQKPKDITNRLKNQLFSLVVNKKILDSNPLPGDSLRIGEIYYKRDPERFLFSYCFRGILSGIKSSILKNPDSNGK